MIEIGTELYYTGDAANVEGFFRVTGVHGYNVYLQEIDGERTFNVFRTMIGTKYEGHCGTRFVTRDAYNAYREEAIARFINRAGV